MASLWLSLFALSASWLFGVPLFSQEQPGVWAAFVLVGVGLLVYALRRTRVAGDATGTVVLLLPAVVAALLLPHPYGAGPAVLALGVLAMLAAERTRRAGVAISLAGSILTVQAMAVWAYVALTPRLGEGGPVGILAALALKAFGIRVTRVAEGLLLDTGAATLVYSLAWEKLGVLVLLLLVAGAIPLIALGAKQRSALPVFVVVSFLYAEVRLAVLIAMFAVGGSIEVFWSGLVTVATFLPLAGVLAVVVPLGVPGSVALPESPLRNRRFWLAGALAFLAIFVLVGSFLLHDPGVRKAGRVIMDEGHSDWEWSTDVFDTEWYGERSGYNYYCLYEYLDVHYEMERNFEPIADDVLSRCDVLIIKTPTEPFTAEEIDAMERFVAEGGGLWLVGDHTNVFGTSTNLNPLAERFGLTFNHDATYELDGGTLSEYRPPRVAPHPIVQHVPPPFLFGTSCSLGVTAQVRSVITGYGLKALDADYSQDNFFAAVSTSPEMRFGPLLQGAAVQHGKGRVAAFSDSTVFSNFWMFMPGKPELAVSYVEWLNRENTLPHGGLIAALLAAGLVVAALYVVRGLPRSQTVLTLCAAALLAVPLAVQASGMANARSYPLPEPRREHTRIAFEQEYSDFAIPSTLQGFQAEAAESLHTFYVWTQRLGYVPSQEPALADALESGDVVVLVNPVGTPTGDALASLERYVAEGGALLVLDNPANEESSANAFLEAFGLSVEMRQSGAPPLLETSDDRVPIELTGGAGSVVGGTPLVVTQYGDAVCARVRYEAGTVAAFADSGLFFNAYLGDVSRVPIDRQRRIGELEFALLRHLAEGSPFEF